MSPRLSDLCVSPQVPVSYRLTVGRVVSSALHATSRDMSWHFSKRMQQARISGLLLCVPVFNHTFLRRLPIEQNKIKSKRFRKQGICSLSWCDAGIMDSGLLHSRTFCCSCRILLHKSRHSPHKKARDALMVNRSWGEKTSQGEFWPSSPYEPIKSWRFADCSSTDCS